MRLHFLRSNTDAPRDGCDTQQPFFGERELERAAAVVEHRYAYVGVTEDMDTSLCILERLYPLLLRGLCGMPQPNVHEKRPHTFKPNVTDLRLLRQWNGLDLRLYGRVVQRHLQQAVACGLKSALSLSNRNGI